MSLNPNAQTPSDVIPIRCEGSGAQGHSMGLQRSALCPMCGLTFATEDTVMPEHERDDILARLARGDFG